VPDQESIEDDRLRLIFTCCHPALPPEARTALTLREVCGLTTEEIARAFLIPPTDESLFQTMSEAEGRKILGEYLAFNDEIKRAGHFLDSNRLQPSQTATTVRVRNGKTTTTDGPFAETKEQLGGYYLVEAKDLNEAIQIAAKIPSARFGSVEIRPVWEGPQV